jgi:hypothetical protein
MSAPPERPPAIEESPREEPPDLLEDLSSPESSGRVLHHAVRVLVVAVVAISIVAVVLSQVKGLRKFDWQFDPAWLALAVIVFFVIPGIHAELWRRILAAMGCHIPLSRGWAIWSVSLLARYVPTQLLMPITRISLSAKEGVPKRICLGSIVYEFALAAAGSVAVAAAFVVQLHSLRHQPERWLIVAVPLVALIVLQPRVFGWVSAKGLRRMGREPLPIMLSTGQVLVFFIAYLGSFIFVGAGVMATLRAVHSLAVSDVPIVLTSWAVGYAGALIAFFVPGGLGVRDGATASVLATAVPVTVAVAVAVLVRLIQTCAELVYAGAATFAARRVAPVSVSASPGEARTRK